MEYNQPTTLFWQTFVCLLFFLLNTNGLSVNTDPEIISTQDEIITYTNHTAKLSCIIQNRMRQHVTWSRVNFINDTQKLMYLLFIDLHKYTPYSRYDLTHLIEKDDREYWNLEIRQVHLADQGYYSCALTGAKPISKLFYVKVIENTRNLPFALRSTSNMQRLGKEQINSSLSFIQISISRIILMFIIILFI